MTQTHGSIHGPTDSGLESSTRLKSALDSQFLPLLFVGSAVVLLDGAAVFALEGCAKIVVLIEEF